MLAGSLWVVDGDPVVGIGWKSGWKKNFCAGNASTPFTHPKAAKEKTFDLMFIDKASQARSGFGLCRKKVGTIRAEDLRTFLAHILDGDRLFQEVTFIYAGGSVIDLYKPFARQELLSMIRKTLGEEKL